MMILVNLLAMRNAAVSQLSSVFASRSDLNVITLTGPLDETGIKHMAAKLPCLATGLVRVRYEGPGDVQTVDFVTWLMVKATARDPRCDDALTLLSVLVPALKGLDAVWAVGGATDIDAKNLFSGQLEQQGLSLWATAWAWPVRAPALELPGDPSAVPGEIIDLLVGGVPTLDGLETFAGFDADTLVGSQVAQDSTDL